ncbi:MULTISPECIES: ribosome hibernation-promoting factor, HPF/YfiA family [Pelosinus]|uniref:Ribosome hibernation promoting factor n=1 Tax=Pelosinus fermentans B4 TaxID=1149862 RepID=I9B738_9FIRM|nr:MULTISPECIES: ribosome-associated translation inhibitor RaiA [Pelosinus]EIW20947.1 ribosomal subunit interface protein [Pelosinus fermentans B4]EIW27186.1 sigma 54 modulation protein/ribosomal protein S30EA [Pelosinus fermentans A11]
MAIIVRGKNIEITPALKEYVVKRTNKITKYFDTLGEITAILAVEKGRHIIELTVPVNGMILRGEEATADMYTSIDLVVDKIEKQIEKYKTKISRRMKAGTFKGELVAATAAPEVEELHVVKTKRFAVKPMDIEEAILQMNLVNHDFYVFSNSETEEVNVVYRRKDGRYGLIEPDFN